ncbi:hypothetical protein JHW43_003570 [Diplocarpon mali]|nr:hypothetical protein JHW43_003570 [Diplocarpon mali]
MPEAVRSAAFSERRRVSTSSPLEPGSSHVADGMWKVPSSEHCLVRNYSRLLTSRQRSTVTLETIAETSGTYDGGNIGHAPDGSADDPARRVTGQGQLRVYQVSSIKYQVSSMRLSLIASWTIPDPKAPWPRELTSPSPRRVVEIPDQAKTRSQISGPSSLPSSSPSPTYPKSLHHLTPLLFPPSPSLSPRHDSPPAPLAAPECRRPTNPKINTDTNTSSWQRRLARENSVARGRNESPRLRDRDPEPHVRHAASLSSRLGPSPEPPNADVAREQPCTWMSTPADEG